MTLQYDSTANIATIAWAAGEFPDGRYQLVLKSSDIVSGAGLHLDGNNDGTAGGDFSFDFFQLAGDANRDGTVGFADLVAVAQHYGTALGANRSGGDVTGDGAVDFADLVVVAQHYGTGLSLPPAASVAAPLDSQSGDGLSTIAASKPPATVAAPSKPQMSAVVKPALISKPVPATKQSLVPSKPAIAVFGRKKIST